MGTRWLLQAPRLLQERRDELHLLYHVLSASSILFSRLIVCFSESPSEAHPGVLTTVNDDYRALAVLDSLLHFSNNAVLDSWVIRWKIGL